MAKITIIVPVYNVEKYLEEAIESAMHQTYSDVEIILVDDGSQDFSGVICDEYAKKDSRIKVVHQKNKGLSGARNTGLDMATGEYIMFLDSDDAYEENACEILLKSIEETNADYIVGNYINMDEDGLLWDKPIFDKKKYQKYQMSIEDYTNSFYTMNSGVWNKIFRREFLEKLNLRFVERLPAEDAIFTTYCFIKSTKVYYIPEIVYHYRLRYSDSISTNCSKKYFLGINKAYYLIYNNFKENNCLNFYRYFHAKSMNYILYKFIDTDKLTKEERIEVLENMKWFYMLSKDLKIPTVLKSVRYIIESIIKKDYEQALKYCEILNQVRKMLPKEIREKMSKPNASTYKEVEENEMEKELLMMKEELLEKMKASKIKIIGIEESIRKIKNEKKSIARFGDGEFELITGGGITYQSHDVVLNQRLEEILRDKQDFCLIGIPDVINGFDNLTKDTEVFWIKNMSRTRDLWMQYLHEDMVYCTAELTRLYIRYEDRTKSGKHFELMKELWQGRDIIICEGEQTRIGVGNDLLKGCKSIRRVICPSEDAFSKYDEILEKLKSFSKDTLILIALGPTATVLAYDLAKDGYQALDIGHLDIEYEWYLRHASKREKIQNKYTNEIVGGNRVANIDDSGYKKQVNFIIQ